MQVKIPNFLSKISSGIRDQEAKKALVLRYQNWLNNEMTKEFLEWVEFQLQDSIDKEESKDDFLTLFQSKYYGATQKGKRSVLRKIIKQFK